MAGDPLLDYAIEDDVQQGTSTLTPNPTLTSTPSPNSQANIDHVVYEDDLVMIEDLSDPSKSKIGLVDYIAEYDSDIDDDEVPQGHMRVLWLGEQHDQTLPTSAVKIIDRATVSGDIVSLRNRPLGQKGRVIAQELRLDIRFLDGRELRDVDSVNVEHIQPVLIGAVVLHEGWVGRVEDTMFNIVVQFDEGQISRIPQNLITHDVVKAESQFDALGARDEYPVFYPGLAVSVDLRRLSTTDRREITWIQGRQKMFGAGKVLSVEPTVIEVDWLALGVGTEMRHPPNNQIRIDQATRIMDHNHFYRWELGDYGYFCELSAEPVEGNKEGDGKDLGQEELQGVDQKSSSPNSASSTMSKPPKKCGVRVPKNKRNRMHGGFGRGFRRNQGASNETIVSRSQQVVRVIRTRQLVDILWQDGTISHKIPSVDLLLPEHISDQDLFPGDFVQEKLDQGDDPNPFRKLGFIKKLDAEACTANVQWIQLDQDTESQEEELSVYEIQDHLEYEYNWGDIVSQVNAHPETDISQRIGQVVGTENGKVKIQWANGLKGAVLPDEIVMLSPEEGYLYDDEIDEDVIEDDQDGDEDDDVNGDEVSWATDEEYGSSDEPRNLDDGQLQQNSSVGTASVVPVQVQFKSSDGTSVIVPDEYIDSITATFKDLLDEYLNSEGDRYKQLLSFEFFTIWVRQVAQGICNRMEVLSSSMQNLGGETVTIQTKIDFGLPGTQEGLTMFAQKYREELMYKFSDFSSKVVDLVNQKTPQAQTTVADTPRPWWARKGDSNKNQSNNNNAQESRKLNAIRNAFNWFGKKQLNVTPPVPIETISQQPPDIQMDLDQPSTSGQSSARDINPVSSSLPSPTSFPMDDGDSVNKEQEQGAGTWANAIDLLTAAVISTGDPQHSPPMSAREEGVPTKLMPVTKEMTTTTTGKFLQFDIDPTCPQDHFYATTRPTSGSPTDRARTKRIQKEWGMLTEGLPTSIWVRTYEDRTDLLRAAISGADDTPYHDGLFFFDVYLHPDFPAVPPKIHYVSYGMKPNPNLYETGHVCLSLVNTWDGREEERWNSKTSSLLQLFVSIQGLVLVSKPYFNEAGFDRLIGQPESEKNAKLYNEQAFIFNCKTMLNQLRTPPSGFDRLVNQHFAERGERILKGIQYYMNSSSSVEYTQGLVLAANKDVPQELRVDWAPSLGFQKLLEKLRPKMQEAFEKLAEASADSQDVQQDV
eukprot:TRINITY_DN7442_c1_g1_i3.p1 TRINITY_DN7442_c1_g1~~TRINITY_DN7442_c1_g1_i3.p1  ORF type:complete len:1211 (-),score=190.37 TRINITY_DN7442_c1_g1_i3:1281-4913(-)